MNNMCETVIFTSNIKHNNKPTRIETIRMKNKRCKIRSVSHIHRKYKNYKENNKNKIGKSIKATNTLYWWKYETSQDIRQKTMPKIPNLIHIV
jgi:ribosomal protein L14E/L6E/L27E